MISCPQKLGPAEAIYHPITTVLFTKYRSRFWRKGVWGGGRRGGRREAGSANNNSISNHAIAHCRLIAAVEITDFYLIFVKEKKKEIIVVWTLF